MPKPAIRRRVAARAAYADACAVAEDFATDEPIFCFSRGQLLAKLTEFRDGFPGEVSFAVKSNPSTEILATLAGARLRHWDVASVHEMAAVAAVCAKPVFHYHNPVKSRREIAEAYKSFGCRRFAVDCREELAKVGEVTKGDKTVEIAVRFVLPRDRATSAHDFSTKFGAPDHICAALLQDAKARGFRPMLTFHPGSQTRDPHTYVRHIEAAARIAGAAGVRIGKLNVGGGFPATYLTSRAEPLAVYFAIIRQAVTQSFGEGQEPRLECEPGRGLVATCMSLLARVKLVCTDGDDIFINDGIYGGLMEFMQVPELQPPYRAIRSGAVLGGPMKSWKVFGPTCDPLDVLPRPLDLPTGLRDDDFIEFGTLGAYGLATATRFNSYGEHRIVTVEQAYNA